MEARDHPSRRTDRSAPGSTAMWASVAGGWGEHADFVDARGAALTERLLELTAPRPGERVLELACGPGGVGLAAAAPVAPDGEVVLSDVAPEMTAIAAQRGAAPRPDQRQRPRRSTSRRSTSPTRSFDVVLCREGLMLVPDPARAAREIARVLRPGGRVAIAVWGPRERNPWLGVVLRRGQRAARRADAAARRPRPVLARRRRPARAACSPTAGLADVAVDELAVPYRAASFEEWWTRTAALAGPLAQRARGAARARPPRARGARAAQPLEPFRTETGYEFPGVALVAAATVSRS